MKPRPLFLVLTMAVIMTLACVILAGTILAGNHITALAGYIVCGLFLLGVISMFTVAIGKHRLDLKRLISCGMGASLGGLVTVILLRVWELPYVRFVEGIARTLGIRSFLPASIPFDLLVVLGALISGMLIGVLLMWWLTKGWTRTDE